MFWRKKQPRSDIFSYDKRDRRESFRLSPPAEEPIFIDQGERRHKLVNIGAQGLAFHNADFRTGEELAVHFILPGLNRSLDLVIKIMNIDANDVCHCCFLQIPEQTEEAIHQYMLAKQKEEARKRKQP